MVQEKLKPQTESEKKTNELLIKTQLFFRRIGGYISAALVDFKRSPMTIFFSIAYPVILVLLFGAIFSGSNVSFDSYTLFVQSGGDAGMEVAPGVVLNYTDITLSILEEMETNESEPIFLINYIPLHDSENNPIIAGEYMDEVGGDICLVFPENFTQKVLLGPLPVNVTIIRDMNSLSADISHSIIANVIQNLNLGIAGENDTRIGMVSHDIYLEEEIPYLDFLIPGIVGVTIMNNAVIGTINRYTFFRNRGLFRKLAVTPMKRGDLVLGESIWQSIQGLVSVLSVIIFGWLVFKLPNGDFGWIIEILDWKMIPILIAGVCSFTGLGMIASRLVKNTDAATAAGNFLTFPMMFLSGAFFDVSAVAGVNIVSKCIPLTYMIDALRASMVTNNSAIAWTNIGISFAFGIALLVIGILVTRISDE